MPQTEEINVSKAIEQFKNKQPKNKTFNLLAEIDHIMRVYCEDETNLLKAIDTLNKVSPPWFRATLKSYNLKDKKVQIEHEFLHLEMGDMVIEKYKLVKYPKLIEGAMYEENKGIWRYFTKGELKQFCDKIVLKELLDWQYYDQKYIQKSTLYIMQKTYDPSYMNSTPFEESKPELVAFKNGTYNMITDEIVKHSPNFHIMTLHDYDLDMSGKANPNINALLGGMVGENAIFLKQFIGYMFYRSYSPAPEMVFFRGEGGEGKSTLLNFITKHLIGSENATAITPQDLAKDKFLSAELLGKSINVSADISDDYIEDASMLKRITGGDPYMAQQKGMQGFSMINYAKQVFSANTLPRFRDLSGGFGARLVVLPFINGNQRLAGSTFWKDHDMDKIEQEAPSFAYECIREFAKVFDGKRALFTKPKSMQEAIQKWLYENDHIGEFLTEYTNINIQDDRGEIATTVYEEYTDFCNTNQYKPKSSQAFKNYLEKIGVLKKKTTRGYDGADGRSHQWRYIGLELIKPSIK